MQPMSSLTGRVFISILDVEARVWLRGPLRPVYFLDLMVDAGKQRILGVGVLCEYWRGVGRKPGQLLENTCDSGIHAGREGEKMALPHGK